MYFGKSIQVGHAIRDKQLSNCRRDQKVEDPSKVLSVTRALETFEEDREKGRFDDPCLRSIFGQIQHHTDALTEATEKHQRMTASTTVTSIDPILRFEFDTQNHKPFSHSLFRTGATFGTCKHHPCQAFLGEIDWNYQRLVQDLAVNLQSPSKLESLRNIYRQEEAIDISPTSMMNPSYSSSWSASQLLSQSSMKHSSLSALFGFHLPSLSLLCPIQLRTNPIRSVSDKPIIISIGQTSDDKNLKHQIRESE